MYVALVILREMHRPSFLFYRVPRIKKCQLNCGRLYLAAPLELLYKALPIYNENIESKVKYLYTAQSSLSASV